ncbi:hypothetical protein Tco_1120290 [Tanacetum coccineum]
MLFVSRKVKLHGIPVTAFSEDGLSAIATKLGTPLMLDSYTSDMCIQSWGRSSYARALIEVQVDVELKDNIVVVMPKLVRDGFYTRIDECPKIIDSDVVKNMKKPSQATRSVLVGPNVGFRPVSNSNPFDVLNSVENDVDLGTNGETSNLASKKTNSSGSLFWNVESSSITHYHIDHTRYDGTHYSYVPSFPDLGVQQGVNFMSGTPGYSTAPSPSASQFGMFGDAQPSTSRNQDDINEDRFFVFI